MVRGTMGNSVDNILKVSGDLKRLEPTILWRDCSYVHSPRSDGRRSPRYPGSKVELVALSPCHVLGSGPYSRMNLLNERIGAWEFFSELVLGEL